MSTVENQYDRIEGESLPVFVLGIVLTVTSLLGAGWLLATGDVPTGLMALLLTVAGGLCVAIGRGSN